MSVNILTHFGDRSEWLNQHHQVVDGPKVGDQIDALASDGQWREILRSQGFVLERVPYTDNVRVKSRTPQNPPLSPI